MLRITLIWKVAKENRVMSQYEEGALMNVCEDSHVLHVNVHRTVLRYSYYK